MVEEIMTEAEIEKSNREIDEYLENCNPGTRTLKAWAQYWSAHYTEVCMSSTKTDDQKPVAEDAPIEENAANHADQQSTEQKPEFEIPVYNPWQGWGGGQKPQPVN